MKKLFVLILIFVFSIFFSACEDDVAPIPLPPPPPQLSVMQPTKAPEESPAAQKNEQPSAPPKSEQANAISISSSSSAAAEKISAPAPVPAPAPVAKSTVKFENNNFGNDFVEQLKSGAYSIQIGVFSKESIAKALVSKMAKNNIKAYYAQVYNPDPKSGMTGLYYRVRVGFFDKKSVAETFAKTRLEPLGYAWWVAYSRDDNLGGVVPQSPPQAQQAQAKTQAQTQAQATPSKPANTVQAAATTQPKVTAQAAAAPSQATTKPSKVSVKIPPPAPPPKTSAKASQK